MTESKQTLIDFPCDFTIKVMGKNTSHFDCSVVRIVKEAFPNLTDDNIERRLSKNSRYLSMSITVFVSTQQALDALYGQLTEVNDVMMVI